MIHTGEKPYPYEKKLRQENMNEKKTWKEYFACKKNRDATDKRFHPRQHYNWNKSWKLYIWYQSMKERNRFKCDICDYSSSQKSYETTIPESMDSSIPDSLITDSWKLVHLT